MSKNKKRPVDINQLAKLIVDKATSEKPEKKPKKKGKKKSSNDQR